LNVETLRAGTRRMIYVWHCDTVMIISRNTYYQIRSLGFLHPWSPLWAEHRFRVGEGVGSNTVRQRKQLEPAARWVCWSVAD